MSLRTYKKISLVQKQQEQTEREKKTTELLMREREFSKAQQNSIADMRENHTRQLEKLQRENTSLSEQLEETEDANKTIQAHMRGQEQKQKIEMKRWECQLNEAITRKENEFKDKELKYKTTISNLEKKLNFYEMELSYIKSNTKSRRDASIQTNAEAAWNFSTQRMISLSEHLGVINLMKQDFYKEKLQIQEEYREKLSKAAESKSKNRELDSESKHSFQSEKLCEGSKIIATLEQQKCDRNKKKMEELIQYYLRCLDEKSKQCSRQQDLIQKLQALKKRQENKIQQLTKTVNFKNISHCSTNRECDSLRSKQGIISVRHLTQQVIEERTEVENFLLDLIQHVKSSREFRVEEPETELTSKQREDILNLLLSNLKQTKNN